MFKYQIFFHWIYSNLTSYIFFGQNISKYFNDVLVFSQYGLACKYEIIFQISIYFVIPGVTIADQARL